MRAGVGKIREVFPCDFLDQRIDLVKTVIIQGLAIPRQGSGSEPDNSDALGCIVALQRQSGSRLLSVVCARFGCPLTFGVLCSVKYSSVVQRQASEPRP